MKYIVKIESVIVIEAMDDEEASKKRYALLHSLMDDLLLNEEINGFVETSEWVHHQPEEVENGKRNNTEES